MARIAMGTHVNCVNILKDASSSVYLPSFLVGAGDDTCFYSSDGAASSDACNAGARTLDESRRQPFCPCQSTGSTQLFEKALISEQAPLQLFTPGWTAVALTAVIAAGTAGGLVAARVAHAWYS